MTTTTRTLSTREKPSFYKTAIAGRLQTSLRHGQILLADRLGETRIGPNDAELTCRLDVEDPRFYRSIGWGASMGAAESYMAGWWDCDDLTSLFRIFCRDFAAFQQASSFLPGLMQWGYRVGHWWSKNTRFGSRRNIGAHYDLGNDFFRLMLDETMMYSSGFFPTPETPLREASEIKLERICQKLRLGPEHHLLEIGTGWGGFAIHAARDHGCRVTTTTISREQFDYATRRVRDAGLASRVTVLCQDYRDLQGSFDKIVSIEMVEAVGREFLETFFRQCGRLLKPSGDMLLQSITMVEPLYQAYCKNIDFIQRYIFPGGFLPSVTTLTTASARASDLRMVHLEDFGPHYARTLQHWRRRFLDNLDEIRSLGYSEKFLRMWEYYLCYCEAGFLERGTGLVQMLFSKPASRLDPYLGARPV